MNLPTKQEINPVPEDLDGQCAVRHFLGKTREQITTEFAEHGMAYQEDLLFMGSLALCYYFPAAVDYIASAASFGDGSVVNCLRSVIEHRLEFDRAEVRGAFPSMVRFAEYVMAHYGD